MAVASFSNISEASHLRTKFYRLERKLLKPLGLRGHSGFPCSHSVSHPFTHSVKDVVSNFLPCGRTDFLAERLSILSAPTEPRHGLVRLPQTQHASSIHDKLTMTNKVHQLKQRLIKPRPNSLATMHRSLWH